MKKQDIKKPTIKKTAMKKLDSLHKKIEAILFLEHAFISEKALANKASCASAKIESLVNDLNMLYQTHGHSICIIKEQNNYLLAIDKELSMSLAHLYKTKEQQKISKALLETLAVIAYAQPITKPEIDELRGVNADGAIRLLIAQNLIKVIGKKPVPGNPNQYHTTKEFLKTFGLKSINELPKMNEEEVKKFISQQHEHFE